jgi:hypothetical protein
MGHVPVLVRLEIVARQVTIYLVAQLNKVHFIVCTLAHVLQKLLLI